MRPIGKLGELARLVFTRPCPTSKRRYLTAEEATKALRSLERKAARLSHETNRIWPMNIYQCPECTGWHLTSQTYKYKGDQP